MTGRSYTLMWKFAFLIVCTTCFNGLLLYGQQKSTNTKTDALEYRQREVPLTVPEGYIPVSTFVLNSTLTVGALYEVGFWIIGEQRPTQALSLPIALFPALHQDKALISSFEEIKPNQTESSLVVKPPPSFASRGYFTFMIRPKHAYQTLTIALKKVRGQLVSNDFTKGVKVIGFRLKPVKETNKTQPIKADLEKDFVNLPSGLGERKLMDSGKSYTIAEKNVQLGLYDHRNIDGDHVTIYLNDKVVVHKLRLKREKRFFEIVLRPGPNIITLYAENLGEVGPNTAPIVIKSSSKEFMAVLEADMGQSQFFTLINTER